MLAITSAIATLALVVQPLPRDGAVGRSVLPNHILKMHQTEQTLPKVGRTPLVSHHFPATLAAVKQTMFQPRSSQLLIRGAHPSLVVEEGEDLSDCSMAHNIALV